MSKLYASPLRVYLLLGALALIGIYSGFTLPISLFPNSSKPMVWVGMRYGNFSAEEFVNTYGKQLEQQVRTISAKDAQVEEITATYNRGDVEYNIQFKWGVQPNTALKEVQNVVNAFASRLPQESRDSTQVWLFAKNSGFFAMTFYSEKRSLEDLYNIIEPILMTRVARVEDAQDPQLWNPEDRQLHITLHADAMAGMQIFPRDVEDAVIQAIGGRSGGSLQTENGVMTIQMPRQALKVESLNETLIPTPSGRAVHLADIAHVDIGTRTIGDTQTFKTNGAPSLFLYARPKPGGNVKKMSEDIMKVVQETMPLLPADTQYRVLVDPSEFIRGAINNVLHEVAIAALLAVIILFLFIGSFKNVATAAIEIPLSMVLAFILMKLSGMNLNLISLGGLALAAGMNVDGSVVVMENIFRHFEMDPGPHDYKARLRIITEAVKEVRFAILASTAASLVVFLPLTFTSALSYAILGDLALAVVFSHGFSAFVALLLVPTVRLQLMSSEKNHVHKSPIDKQLGWLERTYSELLGKFIARPKVKTLSYLGLGAVLLLLAFVVLPRLPKEIVGAPDTDWMTLGVTSQNNTLQKQMEGDAERAEREMNNAFGDKIRYNFTQVMNPNFAVIMARMKDKKDMRVLWKQMEEKFTNTPLIQYNVGPWNPSELPIPDPPEVELAVRGGDGRSRAAVAKEIGDLFQEKKILPRVNTQPRAEKDYAVFLEPYSAQWATLRAQNPRATSGDIADMLRVATNGRKIGQMPRNDRLMDVVMEFDKSQVRSVEDIGAFPIGLGPKLVPLRALAKVASREADPAIYRKDLREVFIVSARENKGEDAAVREASGKAALTQAKEIVKGWEAKRPKKADTSAPTVTFEDPAKDLNEAIYQLSIAVGLSIVLIFLTLLLQFGSFMEPLLVLVSIPLGFIGVMVSLFVFQSTLSLNSILGVILLNGIAVANSIILVDFIKRLHDQGMPARTAAVEAARKRLRPILITSLCTLLGMLPVALGTGEGGRILQPLGIAVSGGMWVSTFLTLFLVPALHVSYLEWRDNRQPFHFPKFLWSWRKVTATSIVLISLFFFATKARADETTTMNFEDALKTIVDRSVSVDSQKANLERTRAKNLPNKLSLLPSINLKGTYGVGGTNEGQAKRRAAEAEAELNIFKFGSDVSSMKASGEEEDAQELTVTDSQIKTESEGLKAIVALTQAKLEVEILKQILHVRDEAVKIANERYARGLLAAQESEKFTVDRNNTLARLADADNAVLNAEAELKALLGHNNVQKEWPWSRRLDENNPLFDEKIDLSKRPDWLAAAHRVEGAEQRRKQELGKVLPSLDAQAGYGYYSGPSGGAGPSTTSENMEPAWRAGVTLTIPLFDRLSRYSEFRQQAQVKALAEIDLEKTRRQAKSEWESARGTLKISLSTARLRERTSETSRRLYQDNLARFRRGLVTANELHIDQDRLFESELQAIKGWGAVHTNFGRLCHSVGKRIEACLSTTPSPQPREAQRSSNSRVAR